jgi:hypothetical protein
MVQQRLARFVFTPRHNMFVDNIQSPPACANVDIYASRRVHRAEAWRARADK